MKWYIIAIITILVLGIGVIIFMNRSGTSLVEIEKETNKEVILSSELTNIYNNDTQIANIISTGNLSDKFADIELKTPLKVIVPVGYQKIAEFKINNYKNYSNPLEKVEFYDKNKGDIQVTKQFDYKILTNESYTEYYYSPTYSKYSNGTNKTTYKNLSRISYRLSWLPFNLTKFNEKSNYTIGIFTQVNLYDNVEWIPTYYGVKINEWAYYIQSSGTITYQDIGGVNYTTVTFTSNGSFNVTGGTINASVLVVGGGGGGGSNGGTGAGGGGGAGGVNWSNAVSIPIGNYNVVVGRGGTNGTTTYGGNGTNSSLGSLASAWYGGGGGYYNNFRGLAGGSGGGGGQNTSASSPGGAGKTGQGNAGGGGSGSGIGGGGGGASTVGEVAYAGGGKGGNGTAYEIYNGTSLYYGGGGGGGGGVGMSTPGGLGGGGGGAGDGAYTSLPGINGTGGGGGGGVSSKKASYGGWGIVIVRFKTNSTYNLTITTPTTENPLTVTSGNNYSVYFNYTDDSGANVTSGVGIDSVFIGGVNASIQTTPVGIFSIIGAANGSIISSTADNATLVDLPNSGSIQQGDIVIVAVACDNALDADGINSTGYVDINTTTSAIPGSHVAYKLMGASPDTQVSIKNNNGRKGAYVIQVWRGVDTSTPIDTTTTVADSGGSGTGDPDSPAITPVNTGSLILTIGLVDDDDIDTGITPPDGYTNSNFSSTGLASGVNGAGVVIASKVYSSGTENPAAWDILSGLDDWRALTVALRPSTKYSYGYAYLTNVGWQVNVTTPTFVDGLKDLFINATYDGNLKNHTRTNAINYSAGGFPPANCWGYDPATKMTSIPVGCLYKGGTL